MKILLSGYGEGSFSTLRCGFDLDCSPPQVDASAVSMPALYPGGRRRNTPGLTLQGKTLKVSWGGDNAMSLTFHELSSGEAVKLARSFLDYAMFLDAEEPA